MVGPTRKPTTLPKTKNATSTPLKNQKLKSKNKRTVSKPDTKPMVPHKFIFVIGGVMSGVGKGIASSSIGMLLSAKGFKVNLVKVDPYLNVDAGTMNPTEHGEVFVLNSGLETDQDMGNYERFLNRDLTGEDYMTSGMIYKHVIDKERALGYGGKCVEAIPHIRDEIVDRFMRGAKVSNSDISIIEIGGTLGDYQNAMFIEAARVLKMRHQNDVVFVMVSYLPMPGHIGEMKSRPTQNAARQLASYGINTDFIIARASMPLDVRRKEKIAISCNLEAERIISAPDIDSIYDVPLNFAKDKFDELLCQALGLKPTKADHTFEAWKKMAKGIKNHDHKPVHIAIVGKYFNTGDFILSDSYLSVLEAIKFSAYEVGVKAIIHTVNSRDYEKGGADYAALKHFDGIIVPGGFGESGIEGKLNVIRFARENKIPYFGLCYGMQLMTIEYARNVVGLAGAQTAEINPKAKHLIIDIMPDQKKKLAEGNYGGSMRLGLYESLVTKGTVAEKAYGKLNIQERHRHRYEVNPLYIEQLVAAGLVFSAKSPDGTLMEIAELPKSVHPFYLGTQFHPELLARPLSPHPLFSAFMGAAKKEAEMKKEAVTSSQSQSSKMETVQPQEVVPGLAF